jgi:hypothetical protein
VASYEYSLNFQIYLDVQIVDSIKKEDSRQRAGVQIYGFMVLGMRVFMLAMLGATGSRLPSVVAFGQWVAEQTAFRELQKLHGMLGPVLGVLGIV